MQNDDAASSNHTVIPSIQFLRGIAILLIVFYHAATHVSLVAKEASSIGNFLIGNHLYTDGGLIGADFLFVICGFVLAFSNYQRTITPKQFLIKRALRIYPLHWICSLMMIGLAATPWFASIEAGPIAIIKSFLMYPTFWYNFDVVRPAILTQAWAMTYIALFYLVFAVTLKLGPARQLKAVTITLIIAYAIGLISVKTLASAPPELRILADSALLEFPLGMWLGKLYAEGRRFAKPSHSIGMILLGCVLLIPSYFSPEGMQLLQLGMPIAFIIAGFTLRSEAHAFVLPRPIQFLGNASYALYLVQIVVSTFLAAGFRRVPALQTLPLDLYFVLAFFAILGAGIATHLFVEKPLLRLSRRFT